MIYGVTMSESSLVDDAEPAPEQLVDHVASAWQRRGALHDSGVDAYRIFHGWAEGCPGIAVDRYGDIAIIQYYARRAALVGAVLAGLDACRRFGLVLGKPHNQVPRVLRGELGREPSLVHEDGLRFWIEPWRRGNPGLYLDARPARQWIRESSRGRRVLNLFAFSGSVGVAAAVGGARNVVHVDMQTSALALCRANHALNGVPIDDRDLMRANLYQHLRRTAAGRQRFDAIIVDAPPLSDSARKSDRTPGGRGVVGLAPLVARMLDPGGFMLCYFHDRERSRGELEAEVIAAAGEIGDTALEVIWRGTSGPDFSEREPDRTLRLTAFARRP